MKILYSLPATGSGHITRCNELLNDLKKRFDISISTCITLSILLKQSFGGKNAIDY